MAPELSRAARRATFALLALSTVAVEIAAADTRPVATALGLALAWVTGAAVLARFVPAPADAGDRLPRWVLVLVLALAGAPFVTEPLRRAWTDEGHPLEIQMVYGLRNVGLGLCACAGWLLCLRTAAVVSLFLMLFSAAMTDHWVVLVLLGSYAAVGSVWLVLVYWAGLRAAFTSSARAVAVEVETTRVRFPWAGLCLLVLSVGGGVALAVAGPTRVAATLGEWVPTSGGTGDTDPFARYGVGNGPEETAGENARAAGMVDTDKLIEDNENSLVDVVSDTYGPPHKPPPDQEKMVAGGYAKVIQTDGKPPDGRRPSRDFGTARKGPKGDRTPGDRAARALFEVEGRTPLHVRLVAYDHYDAAARGWVEARKPTGKHLDPEGGDWMRVDHLRPADWYLRDERHRLKVADVKRNLVPTPPLLTRFRINRVDRPDYYEWDYEGVLALAGRKTTPPGVVVITDCRTLAPHRLPAAAFGSTGTDSGLPPALGEVPKALRPEIERLARAWAGDRPRGWPQVGAVLAQLRTGYAHDRTAAPPADHPAPVLWFLLESRRGPDYLFATAAALLLRALDYPARVCLGYYAAPEAYDRETDHTPVTARDLHFWPEVQLRDGHWLVIEPTPGYEVLGSAPSLVERVLGVLRACAAWLTRHSVAAACVLALVVVTVRRRRRLIDAAAVRWWRWFPGRTWRDHVGGAVRVLERRGRWGGRPRAPDQTIAAWVRTALGDAAHRDPDMVRFVRFAVRAAYSPDGPDGADVLPVCRRVLAAWTTARWRAAPDPNPIGVAP